MSRAYGFGALNAKINTLTSLILTSSAPTPGLADVLGVSDDAGQLEANNFSYISSQTVDGVYDAYLGGLDGIGLSSTAGGAIALTATANCVLQMASATNTALITADPTQMVIQSPDFPLNLVNKGIKLDGVVGAAGTVLTSNGAGVASTWTTQDLSTVLTAGNTAQTSVLITAPATTIQNSINFDTVIVSDPGGDTAVHQLDGFVASNAGDFGQLLKNKLILLFF